MMLQSATKPLCRLQSIFHPMMPSVQARSGAFPSRPFHCSTPVVPVKVNKTMSFGKFARQRRTLLVTNAAIIQKNTLPALDIGARGTAVIRGITNYGKTLADNKIMLFRVLDDVFKDLKQDPYSGENAKRKALILAMAMQETTLLDVNQRDNSKDQTDAANATILNMNYDMVKKGAGYTGSRQQFLADLNNGEAGLKAGLKLLITCFDNTNSKPPFGIIPTLNYHRGGYTGFIDPSKYGCQEYRDAITTIYNKFNDDPDLLNDSRRVEVYVQGV